MKGLSRFKYIFQRFCFYLYLNKLTNCILFQLVTGLHDAVEHIQCILVTSVLFKIIPIAICTTVSCKL